MRSVAWVGVVGSAVLLALLLVGAFGNQAAGTESPTLTVVINEINWSGTACSSYDEWIELYSNTDVAIDLTGWALAAADGTPAISLSGTIPAHGYFLLERADDNTVSDIAADQVYGNNGNSWAMKDSGETMELRDDGGDLVDSANSDGGDWPSGAKNPDFSMERIDPTTQDDDSNWSTNDGVTIVGLDCNQEPMNGTPKAHNSATPIPSADLSVGKSGPVDVLRGERVTYTLVLSNVGQLDAESTWLTDVLPAYVEFVTHSAPYPFDQPVSGTLVWDLGAVSTTTAASPIQFSVSGQVDEFAFGELTNIVTATSATTEGHPADNSDRLVTLVRSELLIEALYYDAYESLDADEAFRVINTSPVTAYLDGWDVTDQEATATFPPGTTVSAEQAIWCAREATAFARQFGFSPDFEYGSDTDPAVPDMEGGTPRFADGDECILRDAGDQMVDVLVYEDGNTSVEGWNGPAVQPWTSGNSFAAEGQILYRKRDQATGLPVTDTDTASDWAQDSDDHIDGRKVRYPGWDLNAFFSTKGVTQTATLTVAVAPDNLYGAVAELLASAQESVWIETYSFRSRELADVLLDRLDHGVSVTLLLEGAPAFEGVTDEEKWIVDQLHDHGAQVLFMINDSDESVHDRYSYQHAKFIIVDGDTVLVGSDNMNHTSLPADDKTNGTAGRRGVYLMTDAPGVVAGVQAVFEADADPVHHADVVGCDQVPSLCTPPGGFQPAPTPDWMTYTVQFPTPLMTEGLFAFEVVQSPENSLRDQDSLLGLLSRARLGDVVLTEQFYERVHWGPSGGTPEADPNPRLEAYVDAARRGAAVRILLDSHFDNDGDNAATVEYLQTIARTEGLDLQARRGNPTFLGLHNKMILAHIGGQGYVHVGSINGSEASSKANRELALQVQSNEAHTYLQAVFEHDWRASTPSIYLPVVFRGYEVPQRADHLLVSEVYYVTIPEKEWVEIYNPTKQVLDLWGYKIGDAVNPDDAEGMYRFPPETTIGPDQVLVIAVTAAGFQEDYPARRPDFEIVDTDPTVPDLPNYAPWGTWDWGLSNTGDEVLLLDADDTVIDALAYGDGQVPGVVSHPGGIAFGHSLERYSIWLDTDDCSVDFRDWPFPSPGDLP